MTKPDHHPTPGERDERFVLPLDPEDALRGLLAVKPHDEHAEADESESRPPSSPGK